MMSEKKKKKNRGVGNWNGLLPIFQFESRYNFCIVTQGFGACSRGPRYDQEAL